MKPFVLLATALSIASSFAGTRPLPLTQFTGTGELVVARRTFDVIEAGAHYTLHAAHKGVTAITITLNGVVVLEPVDSSQTGTLPKRFERQVTLQSGQNELIVEFNGPVGAALELQIDPRTESDIVPPVITATLDPPPNAAGWHRTPVIVTFTCSDAQSGVASCPPPVTVSSDGTNQVVSGHTTDVAGNEAATSVTVNIDTILPTVNVVLSPPPNEHGIYVVPVTAHFTCTDSGSGVENCPTDALVATQGADQRVTRSVSDRAENTATVTSALFTIDFSAGLTGEPLVEVTAHPVPVASRTPTPVAIAVRTQPQDAVMPSTVRIARYDRELRFVADVGPMFDDGTHGDVTPLDGTFTTTLTIDEQGPVAAVFRISAITAASPGTTVSPPIFIPVLANDSPAILRADLASSLRARDRSAVYRRFGIDLNFDLAVDDLNDAVLDAIAEALSTCRVTLASAELEICAASGVHDGASARYEFFSARDAFGAWRVISW